MINFTPPPLALFVGDLDVTPLLLGLSLSRPRPSIGSVLGWSGQFELAVPADPALLPESLDDWVNPSRWLPGNQPVKLYIKNTLVLTVRISAYRYNEDELKATARVVDALAEADYKSPGKDYKGLGYSACAGTTVTNHVNKLLNESGIAGSVSIPGTIPVAPSVSGSFLKSAAQYATERGYYLYLTPSETVAAVAFGAGGSVFLARSECEEFARLDEPRQVAGKVVATAEVEKFANCKPTSGDKEIIEEFGNNGKSGAYCTFRETRELTYDTKDRTTRENLTEKAFCDVFPKARQKSTQLITTTAERHDQFWDSQGRLYKERWTRARLLGDALPDYFDESNGGRHFVGGSVGGGVGSEPAEIEEVEYRERPGRYQNTRIGGNAWAKGVIRYRIHTLEKLFPRNKPILGSVVLKTYYTREIALREVETWIEANPQETCCGSYDYRKLVWTREIEEVESTSNDERSTVRAVQPGELLLRSELGEQRSDTQPPAWICRPAECPTCRTTIKSEVNIRPVGVGVNRLSDRRVEVSASTLTTQAELDRFATSIGQVEVYRSRARSISLPLAAADWWIANPTPLWRARIGSEEFVLGGDSIIIEPGAAELSFVGEATGYCAAPVPEPGTPARGAFEAAPPPAAPPLTIEITISLPLSLSLDVVVSDYFKDGYLELPWINVVANEVEVAGGVVQSSQGDFSSISVLSPTGPVEVVSGKVQSETDNPLFSTIVTFENQVLTFEGEVVWYL